MSFVVKEVYLENFRTHDSLEFKPNEKGVTVIKGENGTGKSSLIDAIAWGIYGIKPNGVTKNADLRRHHMDLNTEKTLVRLVIELPDASEYEIERRILGKKGSTECDVWKLVKKPNGEVEKEHVAGTSVTHASEFILRVVGVNEKGFLASMFVQQKQVDELLTASPKDRSAVIEKMTGITALTEAVADIRVDLRDAKKTMELYGNDLQDFNFDEIKEEIAEKTRQLEVLDKDYADTVDIGKSTKSELLKLQETHKYQSEIMNRLDKQNTVYTLVYNEYSRLKESFASTKAKLEEKTSSLSLLEKSLGTSSAQDILNEYNKKNKEFNNLSYSIQSVNKEVDNLYTIVGKGISLSVHLFEQGLISTELTGDLTASYAVSAIRDLKECRINLVKKQEELSCNIENLNSSIAQKKFMFTSNRNAIDALSNEDGKCPTCHQTPNNLKELLDGLAKSNEVLSKEKDELELDKEKLSGELDSVNTSIENVDEHVSSLSKVELAVKELGEKKRNIKSLKKHKEKLSAEVDSMQELYSLANNARSLESDVATVRNEYADIENKAKAKKLEAKEAKDEKDKLQKEVDGFEGFDERDAKISDMSGELESLRAKVSNIKIEKNSIANAIEYDNKTLAQAEASKQRYEKSVKSYEKVASSSKIVSGFRENRIEEVVPEISLIASSLLQKFTDGKFVSMHLDKSYKANVEQADGIKIDVGLLSGGKLSAVALSFKLAIAMISHKGQAVSTMILDEVLVSQDENRVENIVNTIKEVLDGQVILIGHNGDVISSVADKIIELS